jgi:hypothetical protein
MISYKEFQIKSIEETPGVFLLTVYKETLARQFRVPADSLDEAIAKIFA